MGAYIRQDFSVGWMPSADAFNCPKNALLRMDNCTLDQTGAVALRQGSAKRNTSAMSDTFVDSLFSISINGTKHTYSGNTNAVYLDSHIITGAFDGSGDISFGAHLGQVLMARGTTKYKHDGTTLRNWGIADPAAAPTVFAAGSGTFTGTYTAVIVAVRDNGTYQALSGPSAASAEVTANGQGLYVAIDGATIAALDSQVNQLWIYIDGGKLTDYLRFAVVSLPYTSNAFDYTSSFETAYFTSVSGLGGYTQSFESTFASALGISGPADHNYSWELTQGYTSILIPIAITEVDAIETDLVLESDNARPPDNIIGIEGPHYDRTLVLTAEFLCPSRELDPDAFGTLERVRVGDATETALWIRKLNERVYVGTTRDIYFMDGDWTPQPDGTVNVIKRPLGVSAAPLFSATARGKVNGVDQLIYISAQGWCSLSGQLLTENSVDLLWRGYTRHGVAQINITDPVSRFRSAISKNVLFAVTPEGSDTTSSNVIHAYHFSKNRWYRFVYPQAYRSIYAEPDGTLIAGDSSGFIRELDLATSQDDGVNIPVEIWTAADDDGKQFNAKDGQNLSIRIDTAGDTANLAFHLNGSGVESSIANETYTTAQTQSGVGIIDVTSLTNFTQQQMRITGSFSTFVFRGYQLGYLDSPQPLVFHDTGFIDLSAGDLAWIRRVWIKTISPVDLLITPYFDGAAAASYTAPIGAFANKAYVVPVPLPREAKGRTVRVTVTTTQPSEVYYIQVEFNVSGKQRQKTFTFKPDVAA